MNLSDPDALMIGNMRIFNNELLTQNERIAQSAELWHRYWMEKNGPKQSVDDQTKFFDTAAGRDPELLKTIRSRRPMDRGWIKSSSHCPVHWE